jgi:type IV secretory pathway TrbF-like protein
MAIRQIYGTDVAKVRLIKVVGKFRAIKKGAINKRKETRKAYVTLADSAKLDLNKFEKSEKSTEVKLASSKSKTPKTSEAAKKTTKVKKTI